MKTWIETSAFFGVFLCLLCYELAALLKKRWNHPLLNPLLLSTAAIILLLVGTCVWGVFGRLDTTVQGAAVSDGTALTAYFTEEDSAKLSEGMTVMVNGAEHTITRIDHTPQQLSGDSDDLMLQVGSFDPGAWVLTVALDGGEPEGFYSAEAVIESIAPSKFVFN